MLAKHAMGSGFPTAETAESAVERWRNNGRIDRNQSNSVMYGCEHKARQAKSH